MPETEIRIENARSHNLKGASCRIPLRSLSVITGVSGSGKSSLAFDTLYAEGQRRYVTSLSTYARQFLERLPRPEVDFISNLPPAIAIEQRNRVNNARSTVGTATEIVDHLRLLYAKIGVTRCPDCDRLVEPGTVEAVAQQIAERWEGKRLSVATRLVARKRESATAHRVRLVREGFTRVLDEAGGVGDLSEMSGRSFAGLRRTALLLVDRLVVRTGESRARLSEAVATGFARGEGVLIVVDETGVREIFREGFSCDGCGRRFPKPEPPLFSFNSPLGACDRCQGFGRIAGLDEERVVPDPGKSIAEHAVAPFATRGGRAMQRDLLRACRRLAIPTDRPFGSLSPEQQRFVIDGDDDAWYGVRGFFQRLEGKRYKVQARVLIARYRRFETCPACRGARLRPEALCVRVADRAIAELAALTLGELSAWLKALRLAPAEQDRCGRLLEALRARVETACLAGLDYVTLDRQMRTLSGGEAQRIQLASALGGTLTAALYVLDEPSIGLHVRDISRLLSILVAIRDQGNTVVVVEHAPEIVAAADHVVDLGPGAGREGGHVVVEGDVETIRGHAASLTGAALRGELFAGERPRRRARGCLRIVGASAHNLRGLDVEIPLGQLVVVSGVSGAGKSTLVRSVLVGNLRGDPERGHCDRIEGAEALDGVQVVDPTPPARSPRSNAATLSKAFDGIRRRFAVTREARALGVRPGWFSFNVPGGRCEACDGSGELVVDMQFLEDVRVPCDVCQGTRYRAEALAVRLDGRSIADVLALTVDEAIQVFAGDPRVAGRIAPLARVGLGYLTLGQPLSTLSAGESQRLRVALALADGGGRALYVLDEPTTGLHPADIDVLLGCLDELLDAGGSVVVVEHNLDVIRRADWVLDLGPEGGPGGGTLVAAGPPERIAQSRQSYTGAALRGEL